MRDPDELGPLDQLRERVSQLDTKLEAWWDFLSVRFEVRFRRLELIVGLLAIVVGMLAIAEVIRETHPPRVATPVDRPRVGGGSGLPRDWVAW